MAICIGDKKMICRIEGNYMHRVMEMFFKHHNYEEVEVNIDELKVYIEDSIMYTIVDLSNKSNITKEQFVTIIKQLYKGVISAGKEIKKNIIFGCGQDVDYITSVYAKNIQESINEYNVKESLVIVDTINHNILQDSNAFEDCSVICIKISEYINSFNDEINTLENKESADTKTSVKEFLKKTCTHLAIINVLIFIVLMFVDAKVFENIMSSLSLNWKNVIEEKQWYRIITSIFMHWDINHLFNNMLTLCMVGNFLEKIVGRKWIIISYFVTGILAGLVSLGYNMILGQEVYAAGASGAIFGLIGFLLAVLVLSKGKGEKMSGRRLLIYIILIIWAQLYDKQVDNAAHIGGIFAGVIMGLVYKLSRCKEKRYEN